jgi:hypothetical protein
MKYLLIIFLFVSESVMAANNTRPVVGEGNPSACLASRESARQNATLAAQNHAYQQCANFGDDWDLVDQWLLPAGEKTGNPRDLVQCTSCNAADGIKSREGFKCTVRMLPQVCAKGDSARDHISNADWNAKDRKSGMAPKKESDSVQARNVILDGVLMSCTSAVTFRDVALASEMNLASAKFDKDAERRRQMALAKFDADLLELTRGAEDASDEKWKKIKVAVAGSAIGVASAIYGGHGVKAGASEAERKYAEALIGRGIEWGTFFGKYVALKEPDVTSLATMPVTLLLAIAPHAKAAGVTIAIGGGAIDIATAVAEAELEGDNAKKLRGNIRKRAHDLVSKLQMPRIAKLNAIKNDIDKACM